MDKPLHKNICDELRFSLLFKKHAENLHQFLRYKFGDNLNPKDKTQEAFIKLWQNCEKVSPNKAKSYLYTVANNLMLNEVAHQKVVLNFQKQIPKSHTNENPEFVMEEKEFMKKLQNAISNLTEAQRTAFLLNRIDGKKHKEIAELLNISTKAVEKRIYGAIKKIKEEIEGFR